MGIAAAIKETSQLHGTFALRSGKTSATYFDKYRFESDPQLLAQIAAALAAFVPTDTQLLCGLEMGGIPIVTMLSHHTGLPAAFMRKEAKTYGTCQYAEGANFRDKKLLLVEDVVSSGGALLYTVQKMRADALEIDTAFCVIDRQTGGKEKLAEAGIELMALLTMEEIVWA
jgi:orotate phosphoribosyltransferase